MVTQAPRSPNSYHRSHISEVKSIFKLFLTLINRMGRVLPKRMQRRIADHPGVRKLLERLSRSQLTDISTPDGHRLVINPVFHSNLLVSGDVGGYEPEIRRLIMKLTKQGMTAYDIGANVGVFSFLFSSIVNGEGIVYAFEPEKNNHSCFQKSLEINKSKNIVLDRRAVGKNKGIEKFDRRGGAFSGRLVGEGTSYSPTDNIETIETVNIDYLIKEEGFRAPDILKIDVEGNENMVLEGMQGLLDSHGPIIICELHAHLGESSGEVLTLLSHHGYLISNVDEVPIEIGINPEKSVAPIERHIVAMKEKLH